MDYKIIEKRDFRKVLKILFCMQKRNKNIEKRFDLGK